MRLPAIVLVLGLVACSSSSEPTPSGVTADAGRDVALVACGEPGTVLACECSDGQKGTTHCRASGEIAPCICTDPVDGGGHGDAVSDAPLDTAPEVLDQQKLCGYGAPRLTWTGVGCIDTSIKTADTPLPCTFARARDGDLRCLPTLAGAIVAAEPLDCTSGSVRRFTDVTTFDRLYLFGVTLRKPDGRAYVRQADAFTVGDWRHATEDACADFGTGPFPYANDDGESVRTGAEIPLTTFFRAPE